MLHLICSVLWVQQRSHSNPPPETINSHWCVTLWHHTCYDIWYLIKFYTLCAQYFWCWNNKHRILASSYARPQQAQSIFNLWGTLTDKQYSNNHNTEDNLKDSTPNFMFSFSTAELWLTMNNVFYVQCVSSGRRKPLPEPSFKYGSKKPNTSCNTLKWSMLTSTYGKVK